MYHIYLSIYPPSLSRSLSLSLSLYIYIYIYIYASLQEALDKINQIIPGSEQRTATAMIKPVMNVWLISAEAAKEQTCPECAVDPRKPCVVAVAGDMRSYPDSEPFECWGLYDSFILGPTPLAFHVRFDADGFLSVKVGGKAQLKCALAEHLPSQHSVDLNWGTMLHGRPPAASTGVSDIRYRLLGPLGAFRSPKFRAPPGWAAGFRGRIPRIVHQVWLGPEEPVELTDSWRAHTLFAPGEGGWEHWLWKSQGAIEAAIFGYGERLLKRLKRLYYEEDSLAGRSDFLRWALLYVFGGVYVDADALWLGGPVAFDEHLKGASFVAAYEDHRELLVATGLIASTQV